MPIEEIDDDPTTKALPGSFILAPDYVKMYKRLLESPKRNLAMVVGGVRRVSPLVNHAMSMATIIKRIREEQRGNGQTKPNGPLKIRNIKHKGLRRILLRLKEQGIGPDIFEEMVHEGSLRAASMSPSATWTHRELTRSFGGGRYNITTTPGKGGSHAFAEGAYYKTG